MQYTEFGQVHYVKKIAVYIRAFNYTQYIIQIDVQYNSICECVKCF